MSFNVRDGFAYLFTATVSIPFVRKAPTHPAVNKAISSLCQWECSPFSLYFTSSDSSSLKKCRIEVLRLPVNSEIDSMSMSWMANCSETNTTYAKE